FKGNGGAIYSIDLRGKVKLVADAKRTPQLNTPNGVVMDGKSFLLMVDSGTGDLLRIKLADGSATKLAGGFRLGDGLAWDKCVRLAVRDQRQAEPAGPQRPDPRRRRQRPRLRGHRARCHPRLPQRPGRDEDQGLPRHPKSGEMRRQGERGRLPRPDVPPELQEE